MSTSKTAVRFLTGLVLASLPATAGAQCPVLWEAPNGVLPDQSVPAWVAVNTAPTAPALEPSKLVVRTTDYAENQGYNQIAADLVVPPKLILEAGVWYVSGATLTPARAPIAILFELPGALGNTLFIGADELFLYTGSNCQTKSASVAVPTTDGFHEYRVEVDTQTGAIDVFYDGQHSGLTGSLISFSGSCSGGLRIAWGELSILTYGVSEWAYFEHNAGATGSVYSYCTAGTSASGCQATLSTSGAASATASSGFQLVASGVEGNKDGLYFFGTNGRQAKPWGNGTSLQCVVPPVKRGGLLASSGTNGSCDGAFTQDLNALWSGAPAKNPGAGTAVQAQLWHRDPLNSSNQTTTLSDALEFLVCP